MRDLATTIGCVGLALAALAETGAALAQARLAATVGQKERSFSQEQVTLRPGQAVRFVNDDTVAHNLMVRDPAGSMRTNMLQRPGEQADVAFDAGGTYDVRCAIHPRMRMTVRAE